MPRPRLNPGELGRVSYTTLESGKVRARCLIRTGAGNALHISGVGRTRDEADVVLQRKASVAWGSLILAFEPTITLRELAEHWLVEEVEPSGRKQSTKENYESILRLAVLPHLGAFQMTRITAGVCDRYLKLLRRDHANGYVLNARAVLGLLLRFARRHEAMSSNPLADADAIPTPIPTFVDLEFEQLVVVFDLMRAWRGANPGRRGGGRPNVELLIDVCLIMLGTSMRIGEVLALRKQDIVVTGELTRVNVQGTISETKKYGIIRQPVPKRERQVRSIVAPRFAAKVLRRRLLEYQENPEDLLFPTRRGTPRSTH
ncbi:MAG: site-specific integrase, partial [Microbacterium sp.]|uniref:tyrosine-type recombinase/integrase n=1 Tax=Microbacterium sp. TaxID=51671 RepID=UPI00281A79F5